MAPIINKSCSCNLTSNLPSAQDPQHIFHNLDWNYYLGWYFSILAGRNLGWKECVQPAIDLQRYSQSVQKSSQWHWRDVADQNWSPCLDSYGTRNRKKLHETFKLAQSIFRFTVTDLNSNNTSQLYITMQYILSWMPSNLQPRATEINGIQSAYKIQDCGGPIKY